jgi:hypothetical protein
VSVKREPLEQTTGYWVGQTSKKSAHEGSNKSLSSILDRGHEGRIREVLQEDGRSNMYKVYCATEIHCRELFITLSELDYDYLCSQIKFAILIDVYFSQVKNKP